MSGMVIGEGILLSEKLSTMYNSWLGRYFHGRMSCELLYPSAWGDYLITT